MIHASGNVLMEQLQMRQKYVSNAPLHAKNAILPQQYVHVAFLASIYSRGMLAVLKNVLWDT